MKRAAADDAHADVAQTVHVRNRICQELNLTDTEVSVDCEDLQVNRKK
jgi:hypothetical protein